MNLELVWRSEQNVRLAAAIWRAGPAWRMISSALMGGGLGTASWVLNAQVPSDYSRLDPVAHLQELTGRFGLSGPGVGMLTAASVDRLVTRADEGVEVTATVGLRVPTWAAAPPDGTDPELAPVRVGTINLVVAVPVALSDAALVNAVITATEAKTQAMLEAGYPGTGTASDAICVAARTSGRAEPFAGSRSTWGARIARAAHAAVHAGALDYTEWLRRRL
jgi:adenosylcobinamide amidohydrolase